MLLRRTDDSIVRSIDLEHRSQEAIRRSRSATAQTQIAIEASIRLLHLRLALSQTDPLPTVDERWCPVTVRS
jgi:hypothetical protein